MSVARWRTVKKLALNKSVVGMSMDDFCLSIVSEKLISRSLGTRKLVVN